MPRASRVDIDDCRGDVERVAGARSGMNERIRVLREAAAPIAETGLQEGRAYPCVEAHTLRDLRDVSAREFTNVGDRVDERDLRRKKGIGRVFDHLSRRYVGDDHRAL